jgi:membrane protease YdiL (CAAX protease family)
MEERSLVRQLLEPEEDGRPTPGERRGFGRVPWGWVDLLLVAGLAVVINLGLTPLGVPAWGPFQSNAPVAFFVQVLFSYGLLTACVWLIGVWRHRGSWEDLGFRPLDVRSLAGLLGFLSAVIVAANVAVKLVANVPQGRDILFLGNGPSELVLMGILVLFAAPLAEEVFFRGFLLQGLTRYISFWPAAVLTSAVFAVAHVFWQFFLPIFVLGLAFSWLFWRTGSLWSAIAAHATINGTSFVVVLVLGQ